MTVSGFFCIAEILAAYHGVTLARTTEGAYVIGMDYQVNQRILQPEPTSDWFHSPDQTEAIRRFKHYTGLSNVELGATSPLAQNDHSTRDRTVPPAWTNSDSEGNLK